MVSTDNIISLGVLGLTIGVAAKGLKAVSKPIRKAKDKVCFF